jgi:hypothetical protein
MNKFPNWIREIISLKFTNNKMVCIRHINNDWVYFSRNEYGSISEAVKASNKHMSLSNRQ